jgi:hypothetical protein
MTMTAGCLPVSLTGVARYPCASPTADLNFTIGLALREDARTTRAIPKLIRGMGERYCNFEGIRDQGSGMFILG